MCDNVLERPTASELHPQIQIMPMQSTAARKHSLIPGPMASTDKDNDPTDRMAEPPGEKSHGSKLPSNRWLGEPKRLPGPGRSQGEGPEQASRLPIS